MRLSKRHHYNPIEPFYRNRGFSTMESQLKNAVSIKTRTGNMGFGTVEWVVRDAMQIHTDVDVSKGTGCELRMELTGLPRSIHLHGIVSECWPADDGSVHIRMKLASERTDDRIRLERWIEDQAQGGTSVDPASWTQDLSGVHSRRGRKNITEAFRDRRGKGRALKMTVIDIPLDDLAAELEQK